MHSGNNFCTGPGILRGGGMEIARSRFCMTAESRIRIARALFGGNPWEKPPVPRSPASFAVKPLFGKCVMWKMCEMFDTKKSFLLAAVAPPAKKGTANLEAWDSGRDDNASS